MRRCLKTYLINNNRIFAVLIAIAIILHFSLFKSHSYVYIPKRSIHSVLYRKVIPNVLKQNRPNCSYVRVLFNRQAIQHIDILKNSSFDAEGIENGTYSPKKCNPLFSVAIVVVYRKRQENLDIFLPYIHNFLRRQHIHYKIYIVEQQDQRPFNRGLLLNIGAGAAASARFPCLILHDVDLLPLVAANLYVCTKQPRHLSAAIDKFNFVLHYQTSVGGVFAIRTDQFMKLNGFSNRFWGWGMEDDDLFKRLREQRFDVLRFSPSMSRYTMLHHAPARSVSGGRPLLRANRRDSQAARAQDGLRTATTRARVRSVNLQLYTLLTVFTYGPNVTHVNRTNVF